MEEYKCEMCGSRSHKNGTCCGMPMSRIKNNPKKKSK